MATKDPRVDAYIAKAQPFAQPVLKHLRTLMHTACPKIEETLKWNAPAYAHNGIVAITASFKNHCALVLWKAALLQPIIGKYLDDDSRGQFGKLTSIKDLPPDRVLIKCFKEAWRLNDEGIRAPRPAKKKTPTEVPVPSYLTSALKRNKKAAAQFKAFSPAKRKEYIAWLDEAKTAETREKRLATALEWIAEGKGRNWKYQR